MDHEQAVREGYAERYIHRRLTAGEMDEFEQHFFSCPECAEEVRWLAMFEDNARRAARRSDAAPATLIELAAGAVVECRAPSALSAVLLLPPGDWSSATLAAVDGTERFEVTLPESERSIVVPVRELTPGEYRITAKRGDGSIVNFRFRIG